MTTPRLAPDASDQSNRISVGFIVYVVVFFGLLVIKATFQDGFQPAEKKGTDYIISLAGAFVVFFALYLPKRPRDPSARGRRFALAFGVAYLMVFFGRAAFFAVNAGFDHSPPTSYLGVIERVACSGRAWTWWLVGAPSLPTETNRMSILGADCGRFEGDTVIVDVRAGVLGRPWIAAYSRRYSHRH